MKQGRAFTTREIAAYCSVSFYTVIRWIERGKLKAFQLPGRGDYRITLDNFIIFLKENNIPIPEDLNRKQNKILIVDDDINVTNSLQRMLKKMGFDTVIAHDGFQAGTLLGLVKPSLLLLDIKMPKMSGYEVLDFIRSTKEIIPPKILIISALSKNEIKKALTMGADDFLEKPFQREALLTKINLLLS